MRTLLHLPHLSTLSNVTVQEEDTDLEMSDGTFGDNTSTEDSDSAIGGMGSYAFVAFSFHTLI